METCIVKTDFTRIERLPIRVFPQPTDAAKVVAGEIAQAIREADSGERNFVLGLATGSSPVDTYDELVRLHRDEGLSFAKVTVFSLDEFYPISPDQLQSHARFLHEHLIDHIDIHPDNVHFPDGTIDRENAAAYCNDFEAKITSAGGIDFQLLGVSRIGHIGCNEPGSDPGSRTRLITLDQVTRTDAASNFFGADNVPRHAITMGVATILEAKRIVLLAFGEGKSQIIRRTVQDDDHWSIPSTFLQRHASADVVVDQSAAAALTRFARPWSLGPIAWDESITHRAVIDMALRSEKAILKLTEADYNEHGLQDLLADHGSAYDINLRVFRRLHATITGWPGGKPDSRKEAGDRPGHRDDLFPKRILLFSPHPDDDVISMGGTLIRLVDQGHEVHIAYQTSGNIAVFDDDALRFAEFAGDFCREFEIRAEGLDELESHVDEFLRNKNPGQVDSEPVQRIKALIRRGEAREGARCCGVPDEQLHFLNLPFYQTGRVRKKPLSQDDIRLTVDLMRRVRPHLIYTAGDLSDPHGTHRTCLRAVLQSCLQCQHDEWYSDSQVWLYRGAWQEWPVERIEMAVPLSPAEVKRKRNAIFKHESQKDRALFPGSDMREFWERAESRNADTAAKYDTLGLAEYAAIEGFVRWDGQSGLTV
ncbi:MULTISPECIES: 6-phosphogluconolactonase [Crateriforma]|uniref:Glucosamine-6-phosphate deaminase 1 n=1 Tax=Crateriforma conspicua TaxID=2527996 RepID=A0A5C6FNZ5_9PLAN|nr:Glucosamine-6-phosphate deaminase 1 [Crateriforma conspicua]